MTGKRSSLRRRVLLLGAAGAVATLVLCALFHRPIVSHVVTALAFRDAEEFAVEAYRARDDREFERAMERAWEPMSSRYGSFFLRGFLSRREVARRFPPSGITKEAIPAMIVIVAYYQANEGRFRLPRLDNRLAVLAPEFAEWLDPVASFPGPKELLVNVLVGDIALWPGSQTNSGDGLYKLAMFSSLFCEGQHALLDCMEEEELAPVKARLLGLVRPEHWASVIRHTEHPREKVRAGSLLLLNRHPSQGVIVERARIALDDPSEWVRLAGAGLLAIRRIDEGEDILKQGLRHERWEVRYWCVFSLFALAKPGLAELLEARLAVETDDWLRGVLREAIENLEQEPR